MNFKRIFVLTLGLVLLWSTVCFSEVLNQYTVTANASGNGLGSVSSSPAGINYSYPASTTGTTGLINHGTQVVLTAAANTGSVASWAGTCAAAGGIEADNGTTSATCTFASLDGTKTVAATFTYYTSITKPTTPKRTKSRVGGQAYYCYKTGGSVVGSGDPVEYQFEFVCDGVTDLSPWGPAKQCMHWITASACNGNVVVVRARARSTINPYFISAWSDPLAIPVTVQPFIHVSSPNGGETWVVGATHRISWNSNYLDSGRIYLFYWYAGAWRPIADLPASSNISSFHDWTIPSMPPPISGSAVPTSHVRQSSIYIGNWVNGGWQCWDMNDKGFKILDDGWVFTISGGDKGGATLWFDTDESSFDGYGVSFKLGMFKIHGSYVVDDKGVIKGNHQFKDFSGNILPNGNGSITGNVDSKAAKVKLTLKDMSNPPVSVMSMSGVWLSGLSMPEDWSVAISGDAKGAMNPLTIVAYQDSNDEEYANIFNVSGSGLLSDGNTPITIGGYLYFISAKKVYGVYDQLRIGTNSPEDGIFTGTLNLTSGSIKFFMTSSNGNKYTLTGQKKP